MFLTIPKVRKGRDGVYIAIYCFPSEGVTKINMLFRKHILPAVQKMYERHNKTGGGQESIITVITVIQQVKQDRNVALIRKTASGMRKIARF